MVSISVPTERTHTCMARLVNPSSELDPNALLPPGIGKPRTKRTVKLLLHISYRSYTKTQLPSSPSFLSFLESTHNHDLLFQAMSTTNLPHLTESNPQTTQQQNLRQRPVSKTDISQGKNKSKHTDNQTENTEPRRRRQEAKKTVGSTVTESVGQTDTVFAGQKVRGWRSVYWDQ